MHIEDDLNRANHGHLQAPEELPGLYLESIFSCFSPKVANFNRFQDRLRHPGAAGHTATEG